jgi:DNA-binding XRE family transcriptional regulator
MRGKTRDITAKFVGVSHDTLAKMEKIVEAADG